MPQIPVSTEIVEAWRLLMEAPGDVPSTYIECQHYQNTHSGCLYLLYCRQDNPLCISAALQGILVRIWILKDLSIKIAADEFYFDQSPISYSKFSVTGQQEALLIFGLISKHHHMWPWHVSAATVSFKPSPWLMFLLMPAERWYSPNNSQLKHHKVRVKQTESETWGPPTSGGRSVLPCTS